MHMGEPPASRRTRKPEGAEMQMKIIKDPKWKNWWYYYKWYVICGLIGISILCNLVGNALGLWTKAPDFQVAYVGKAMLPDDTVSALQQAFTSVGGDFNKDGEIKVQINQYIHGISNADAETAYYEYGGEIALISDISDCESYFFLTDDPEKLQREFQILASGDGSCPDEMDYSIENKVIAWKECPALYELELGTYTTVSLVQEVTGNNQELLSGLYLGRRCFYTEDRSKNYEECGELWNLLRDSAEPSSGPQAAERSSL